MGASGARLRIFFFWKIIWFQLLPFVSWKLSFYYSWRTLPSIDLFNWIRTKLFMSMKNEVNKLQIFRNRMKKDKYSEQYLSAHAYQISNIEILADWEWNKFRITFFFLVCFRNVWENSVFGIELVYSIRPGFGTPITKNGDSSGRLLIVVLRSKSKMEIETNNIMFGSIFRNQERKKKIWTIQNGSGHRAKMENWIINPWCQNHHHL